MNEVCLFQISQILIPLALKIAIAQRAEAKIKKYSLRVLTRMFSH